MLVRRQWIELNGCRMAYRQWGNEGKPIVLLHGIPMNSSLWERTGSELSENGYRVYAPELLGLGYTEGVLGYDHSLTGQAELMRRFANQIIKEEYILVGHDLGGGIAQIICAESPAGIRKCVFTNCVASDSWPIDVMKPLIKMSSNENYPQIFSRKFTLSFLKKGLSAGLLNASSITSELLNDLCDGLVGTTTRVEHFARFLGSMSSVATQQAFPKLRAFEHPALVIWAEEDRFQPISVGLKLRGALPQADWKLMPGSHFHPLESNALAQAILLWDNEIVT
jgi:2-hydroxymuconate-semialdehyde hydrolase